MEWPVLKYLCAAIELQGSCDSRYILTEVLSEIAARFMQFQSDKPKQAIPPYALSSRLAYTRKYQKDIRKQQRKDEDDYWEDNY